MAKNGGKTPPPPVNTRSTDCHSDHLQSERMAEHLALTFLMAVATAADEAADLRELATAARLAQTFRDELLLLHRAQSGDEGLGFAGVETGVVEDRHLSVGEAAGVERQPSQVA